MTRQKEAVLYLSVERWKITTEEKCLYKCVQKGTERLSETGDSRTAAESGRRPDAMADPLHHRLPIPVATRHAHIHGFYVLSFYRILYGHATLMLL